jgi:anti-sigma B factor antagonist
MSTQQPTIAEVRVVVTVAQIDGQSVEAFGDELAEGLRRLEGSPDRRTALLVVDLSGVEFLASPGIRKLIEADQAAIAAGGRLVICGASGVVSRCLEVTGVLDRFQLPGS